MSGGEKAFGPEKKAMLQLLLLEEYIEKIDATSTLDETKTANEDFFVQRIKELGTRISKVSELNLSEVEHKFYPINSTKNKNL